MRQSLALEIMRSGRSVFLTGEPGAGKSYTVRKFMECPTSRIALTASTGIAATNIGGQTIHAWCGIGARQKLTRSDVYAIRNGPAGRRIRAADTLVIDEISMLSGDVLQMLDYVCRAARDARHEPFGGLQVILVGDFFQLPPVSFKRWRFAFEAPAWEALDPFVSYLTEQHRQADAEFLDLLASMRSGCCDPEDARLWARHVEDAPAGIPFLSTHNQSVDAINVARLKELPGASCAFHMTGEGEPGLVTALKRGCQSPEALTLKEGALVMFTRNDPAGRFVNGSAGVVVDVTGADGWPVVRLKGADGKPGALVTAAPVSWEIVEESDEEAIDTAASPAHRTAAAVSRQTEKRTLAKICQVPLRLSWAITVHKSQGMSLDAAVIDLSRTFEFGQGYVALSRVRSLAGLRLLGWNEFALRVHPAVLAKDAEFRAASDALENDAYGQDGRRRPGSGMLASPVECV